MKEAITIQEFYTMVNPRYSLSLWEQTACVEYLLIETWHANDGSSHQSLRPVPAYVQNMPSFLLVDAEMAKALQLAMLHDIPVY